MLQPIVEIVHVHSISAVYVLFVNQVCWYYQASTYND